MKRRWFQIHLSTAVVLMICAGGVLWLNIKVSEYDYLWLMSEPRGWPYPWGYYPFYMDSEEAALPGAYRYEIHHQHLFLDILIGALLLGFIAVVCEFLVRRREANSK